MLTLSCPACRYKMQIDEAFRGGICRCSDCGAMVTVPTDLEPSAEDFLRQRAEESGDLRPRTTAVAPAPARSTPSSVRRTSSNLRRPSAPSSSPAGALLAVGGLVIVGIVLVVILLANRPAPPETPEPSSTHTPSPSPGPSPSRVTASFTLDDYRKALPEADEKFLIIQMNRGNSLEKAREEWEYQRRQRSNN